MSSRLFQNVREKRGLVYSISSGVTAYSDAGILTVYAGTSLDSVDEVVRLTVEEFRRLKGEPLPAEELRRAKDHLKGSLMLSLENTGSRMSHLARQEIYFGRHFTLDEIMGGHRGRRGRRRAAHRQRDLRRRAQHERARQPRPLPAARGPAPDLTRAFVVLPTLNEAENLGAVVARLREVVPDAQVLVVDDDEHGRHRRRSPTTWPRPTPPCASFIAAARRATASP